MLELPGIVDAFTLNPATRYRPGYYMPLALAALDVLRRANTYRPKMHVLPDDINMPVPAFETLEYQVRVVPGSYLWALLINEYDAAWANVNAADIWLQITDSCNGVRLFDDFVSARAFSSRKVVADARDCMLPHLLTQPRLILEPGLLNVEIANTATTATRCQLVLFTAEPCEIGVSQ